MKRMIALVLVLMLCLPAFASAAQYLSAKETADKVIVFINDCVSVFDEELKFTQKVKEDNEEVLYAVPNGIAMCSLVYASNDEALKGVMFISEDMVTLVSMGFVICKLVDEYYGEDEGLAEWLGTAIAEGYLEAMSTGETSSLSRDVPNGGEVVVYSSPDDDGTVATVLALSGGWRIAIPR